jgi:hypothetical protein
MAYLHGRGLNVETLRARRIGFHPTPVPVPGADTLVTGEPAILTEGEFDTLLCRNVSSIGPQTESDQRA